MFNTWNTIVFHVNINKLHVNRNILHVSMNILHMDITYLHVVVDLPKLATIQIHYMYFMLYTYIVDIINLACRGQRYATIHMHWMMHTVTCTSLSLHYWYWPDLSFMLVMLVLELTLPVEKLELFLWWLVIFQAWNLNQPKIHHKPCLFDQMSHRNNLTFVFNWH